MRVGGSCGCRSAGWWLVCVGFGLARVHVAVEPGRSVATTLLLTFVLLMGGIDCGRSSGRGSPFGEVCPDCVLARGRSALTRAVDEDQGDGDNGLGGVGSCGPTWQTTGQGALQELILWSFPPE